MTISLNGWPVPPKKTVTKTVPGTDRRLTIQSDVAPLLLALAADYHATVRPIDVGAWDEGGFNNRDARLAAGKKSNHASATAIDLNWSEEGAMGSSWGKKFFARPLNALAIRRIKNRYGSVIGWGGDWRAQDFMHWEVKPGVTVAQVKALQKKLGIKANGQRSA